MSDWLNESEAAEMVRRSDLRAAALVASNWLIIATVFALVALWSNPLSWLVGAALLGGRHLGLAILMHEAGHNTLFRTKRLNQVVGQWLCAYPI